MLTMDSNLGVEVRQLDRQQRRTGKERCGQWSSGMSVTHIDTCVMGSPDQTKTGYNTDSTDIIQVQLI